MIRHSAVLLLPLLLCQCGLFRKPPPPVEPPQPKYRVHLARYESLRPQDSRIRIDLASQKATLLNRHGEAVIITDVSTGKFGHETPVGSYKVMEKLETKRSNLYGLVFDAETGEKLGQSWSFKSLPKGAIYEGFEMPYWMRLTHDGVGLHIGHVVPRQAVSFGCIRVPETIQPLIFEKTRIGTRVDIVPGTPPVAIPVVENRTLRERASAVLSWPGSANLTTQG